MNLRLLVSGSRAFTWAHPIWDDLDTQRARLRPGDTFTVVHGDCGDGDVDEGGVDAIVRQWAQTRQQELRAAGHTGPGPGVVWVAEERHPADWAAPCRSTCRRGHRRRMKGGIIGCPAAGNYRNQDMVDTRPDRARVYMLNDSTGADDCFTRIRKARIIWQAVGTYTP